MARLGSLLGIDLPIVQSGMRGVAGPELAAAVSDAGGLGVLAALLTGPDDLRAMIHEMRARTARPFGVNLWLHCELRPPLHPEDLEPDLVAEVQTALDDIRVTHDLAPAPGPLEPTPDLLADSLDVLVSERVPVFSAGLGLPDADLVERFHHAGSQVMAMVADVADARAAVDRGVDVVVAQGAEAGGHRSVGAKPPRAGAAGTSTLVLVPAVRDELGADVPLLAAGGIADGRGVAAAMVLGADGALLGTRFVATAESTAHPAWKQALLAHDRPSTLTDALSGQWARALRNEFVDRYERAGARTLPSLLQVGAAGDIFAAGAAAADPELMPMWAGDSAQLLRDLPPAGDLVAAIAAEAEAALGRSIRRDDAP